MLLSSLPPTLPRTVRTVIDAPTNKPAAPATTVATPSAEPTTTMAPTVVPVSSVPVVPTTAPTWSLTSVTLEELELVYSNVDSINDRQMKMIENITEIWFNDYYKKNATLSSSSSVSDDADEEDDGMAPLYRNVTAVFNFTAREYVDRTMTVLFSVQLTYQGDPKNALMIVQTPWQEATSVGSYRQLLVAGLPVFFDNVEATSPPQLHKDDDQPPPPPQSDDDGLSAGAVIGIVFIVMAIIVLIGVAAKLQYGIIARRQREGGDKISPNDTTPYRPHQNDEEDDSVLFPPAPTPYSSHINNSNNNNNRPIVGGGGASAVEGGTAGRRPMPSGKLDDQSYDGKR
jgi:hypothetical protein